MIRRFVVTILVSFALIAAACGESSEESAPDEEDEAVEDQQEQEEEEAEPEPEPEATVPAEFSTNASAGQITVTDAIPGATLELVGPGATQTVTVDEMGNYLFRLVDPGTGWVVRETSSDPVAVSDGIDVPRLDDHPDQAFYTGQTLVEGLNYLEMRDGTLLAATVRFPGPADGGPYPTVIEYSGYDPADPEVEEPAIGIYKALGYATVGLNMRGSGCSGGAFDYFEPIQSIDGYDAIEIVASQDWVYNNHVGMVGISYSGISQLFVASTQPPSLAAITALSVIEDTYRSTLYPGGIYNNGFAKSWSESRQGANDAYGQSWVNDRVDGGDTVCDSNQLLRSQNFDLDAAIAASAFYDPATMDRVSPRTFVDRINVPVFLAGAWQDEQTGGRFSTMIGNFTGTDVLKVHLYNGAHADSLGPESLVRAFEFLEVYVAERNPVLNPIVRLGAPILYQDAFGVGGLVPPPDRFTNLADALAAIESEPPIRVLLEMGGNESALGGPLSRGELLFESWPPPAAETVTWSLGEEMSTAPAGLYQFEVDVERSQLLTKAADDDGNEFDDLTWEPLEDGKALVFETPVFEQDMVLLGSGSASLSIRADAGDADLQITVTEVRPDGQEMFVQSGWLRASHRTLIDSKTTDVLPWHSHAESDASSLPTDEFTTVEVELFPVGHAFRAGSKLRFIVDSPGGNRNLWAFDVLPNDGTFVEIDTAASSLSLPFITGATLPDGLPPCADTRSQPCRPWTAYDNVAA